MAEHRGTANEIWWLDLPPGAGSPVTVYANGTPIREGEGLEVRDGRVHLDRPLRARPDIGFGRKVMLAIGIGVYGDLKADSIDISFMRNGRLETISDVRPPAAPRQG